MSTIVEHSFIIENNNDKTYNVYFYSNKEKVYIVKNVPFCRAYSIFVTENGF